jgi:hypothetical protein
MIRGQHFQNAYVTRNVDKWVEEFRIRAGVTDPMVYEGGVEMTTPKGTGMAVNRIAFIWVDNLQYELIQPISGLVDIYADALPEDDSLKFHHICMRVPDWDDFRAEVDRQPLPVVLEGNMGGLRFLYLDAREFVGHYLEYVWMTPERWAGMNPGK